MNLEKVSLWRRVVKWKSVCDEINAELDSHRSIHQMFERKLEHHKEQIEAHKSELEKAKAGNRTALKFIMQAHGLKLKLAILFMGIALPCMAAFPPPFIHNPLDTNSLGLSPADGWFLGWTNKPTWSLNAASLTNLNLINATNQSTVVSNGVLAHTITIAGTATGLSFTPAGAQTLSSDPSFTGKILPSAIVTNMFNSGDQYKTNGSISSTAYDIMASNNLGSFSASSGLGTFTATSGAAFLTPTNTPAVGQQIEATSTAGTTAYKNPHFLGTITGWLAGWTGVSGGNSRFMPLMGYQSSATTATEGSASGIYPAGTFTNLYVKWVALGLQTNMTLTLITNGVASNIAVSVNGTGANPTGVDTSHGVQIPDQCPASFRLVGNNPTVPSSAVILYFSIQFAQ